VGAMFNGCLVIGHNTGGAKEILESEDLGILFSTEDELIKYMLEIIEQGISVYCQKILKAQRKVIELYSVEQNVSAVYGYYKNILNKKQSIN
jgi:glycosyltransferase involved in cell wall biosynthesis